MEFTVMFENLPNLSAVCNPAYVAEFFGSLLLILFGCGSCANAALPKTKEKGVSYVGAFSVVNIIFLAILLGLYFALSRLA